MQMNGSHPGSVWRRVSRFHRHCDFAVLPRRFADIMAAARQETQE
jgi:hypothetical protein